MEEVPFCESCVEGIDAYKISFYFQFEKLVREIIGCRDLIDCVCANVSGEMLEFAEALKEFLDYIEMVKEEDFNIGVMEEILNIIDAVIAAMMMLHKFLLPEKR